MQKKIFSVILLLCSIAAILIVYATYKKNRLANCNTPSSVNLNMDMAKLWEDHIVWTRNYIISELADLTDKSAITDRLLKNQNDLGNAIKPVYGNDAGEKLSELLREHILIAADVIAAAKTNNKAGLESSSKKWRDNADQIATFLSNANPHLPYETLKEMLYKHLELTTGQVVSRLKKNWKADIDFYDKNHEHMLMMSKALCDGIKKQFPDKFKN